MKKFRSYARSFAGGLVLGALSLIPGCATENRVEEPSKPVESPTEIPQEYEKFDSEGNLIEKVELHYCEDGSLGAIQTTTQEFNDPRGWLTKRTETVVSCSPEYWNRKRTEEYECDIVGRLKKETRTESIQRDPPINRSDVTEYFYPSESNDGSKPNRIVSKKDDNGDGRFESEEVTDYNRRHVRTRSTQRTDSNQNGVPEQATVTDYRKGELLKQTTKFDDNEDWTFDREEVTRDNSEELSFKDFYDDLIDPKYTKIAEHVRDHILKTTPDFPFMDIELDDGSTAVIMSIIGAENPEDNGIFVTMYLPGKNPKVSELVNSQFYGTATLGDTNFDGLITPDEIIVDEATLQRRQGGRIGLRWEWLAALRQTEAYRAVLDAAKRAIEDE